ncbi:MAG: SAM-dependent methyltransferase [Planctomycetes bacterium]|nr:SAM-dependent methyltransferase [Planctomycetota bacterium]
MPAPKYTLKTADRHDLYQKSVQCPEADVAFITRVFRTERGRYPLSLREDFCGTSLLCAEWVKSKTDRVAYGVDLDREVLNWGRESNIKPLGDKASRVRLSCANVLTPKKPLTDVQVAFNFSYCIFKERSLLLKYLRAARASLAKDGLFLMDIHGGQEAYDAVTETKRQPGFKYVWEQGDFSPVTHERVSWIHFHFPDGTRLKKAFEYDWRIWTCPELRDLLMDAGFKKTAVYWEGTDKDTDEGNGVYRATKTGDNDPSWIAYVIGYK